MKTENKMSRAEQVRIVNEAYTSMPEMQDGFYDVRERLYDMNVTQERAHRRCGLGERSFGISVPVAARLFTVQHLLEGWENPDNYTCDDILHVRNECLYAQAYAKKHRALLKTWAKKYAPFFGDENSRVDYAELMK